MELHERMAKSIELWPVDRLRPYERNARTHTDAQVAKVAASITRFGFLNPILVDHDDGIIAGHCRLMAAYELGLAEVPVVPLDHLTDDERRAYIIADNKLALDAGWDESILHDELADLHDGGFDLALTGFESDELADLLPELHGIAPVTDPSTASDETRAITFNLTPEQHGMLVDAIEQARAKIGGAERGKGWRDAAIVHVCASYIGAVLK